LAASEPLLAVEGLRTHFATNDGIVRAVDGVNFTVDEGETLGVVGESGCGKSITALSIMRLLTRPGRTVAGRVFFQGRNLLELTDDEMEDVRGNDIAMIFQEPMTSLNPVFRVGDQIGESIQRHLGVSNEEAARRVVDLFVQVGIPSPDKRVRDYPHQMSGGMRQRVMIAMALACKPKLLIADEPTTALDVTIQAQILELIKGLKDTENMAVMMITHDLGVIAEVAANVVVMYAGKIVERGPVNDIFHDPQHPYTQGLLRSIPKPAQIGHRLEVIKGTVPHPLNLPPGCTFAPRCPDKFEPCDSAFPALEDIAPKRAVACYLYTAKQDEVRATEVSNIDPLSPLAQEVPEEVLGA
jgi:peptide/nickel transport system ATP-binding protein